ncbi:hypothetical protein NHQ30_006989 [Ciborinia camelliae]|nr:hypothetical protein NHQ30_006989 [Ciborinia camelliae]
MTSHIFTDVQANGNGSHSSEVSTPNTYPTQPAVDLNSRALSLHNPTAIIGMSFTFPQDANSTDRFWSMLMQARCASEDFPESRLNKSSFYHSDATRQDSVTSQPSLPFRGGHFIEGSIAAFDAPFFSISSQEAMGMDPLQRGLLETTYRALENAGLPLEVVIGSKTSVYTGCFTTDWRDMYAKDPDQWPSYAATGVTALSMCANRISWFFNLRGASANVDTACSSSLAIVGAGNLMYSPDILHLLQSMNMLSVDSKCHSFDDRANGYSRGEGFAVIVLKSLTEAVSMRDTIRAVIRATGTNQDGRTQLVTQPSGDAHENLIRETYSKAGLHPSSASYIEAHGTGTPAGDPIEANVIGKVFREFRKADNPLIVGAVKSNIGHLEGASGLAGVIKTVLILERGIIPPNANFQKQNMAIDADFLKIQFPTNPTVWPNSGPRIASVNSFGFGGSNAHVIVEDAYHYLRDHNLEGSHFTIAELPSQCPTESQIQAYTPAISNKYQDTALPEQNSHGRVSAKKLLVFSSADEEGINRIAESYSNHFRDSDLIVLSSNKYWDSLSYTLDSRRTSLPWKCYGVFDSVEKLQNIEQVISPPVRTNAKFKPNFTFIFTGQGAQWPRMGVELMERYRTFSHSLEMCSIALKNTGCTWDLIEELHKSKALSNINRPEYSQPLCTALQVAYIELLRDLNIVPDTVVGHSSGEIAAAYSIGAVSLPYAMKVAYYRGFLAADLEDVSKNPSGAMMAVGLSETDIKPYFNAVSIQYGNCALTVACINSHSSITVSGDDSQLASLESMLLAAKVFARKLQINVAYHSPLMAPIATKYLDAIGDMKEMMTPFSSKIRTTMISSVTGDLVEAKDLRLGSYWVKNMLEPVNFLQAMNSLCQVQHKPPHKLDGSHRSVLSTNTLIEIGPHSALQGPIGEIVSMSGADWIEYFPVLKRYQSAIDTILDTAGRLHCRGFSDLNFASLNRSSDTSSPPCLTDLPQYPFNHSRDYWWESRMSKQYRLSGAGRLDLLGKQTPDWVPHAPRWRNFIKISEMPWIEHHKVNGSILYPAAGMLVMAVEAAYQIATSKSDKRTITGFSIKKAHFSHPLIIPISSEGVEIQFHLRSKGSSGEFPSSKWSEFVLYAWENDQCMEICNGFVRVEYEPLDPKSAQNLALDDHLQIYQKASSASSHQVNHQDLYQALDAKGYEFGPAFRSLNNIFFSENGSKADVEVFHGLHDEQLQPHIVHPATLDGILHLGLTSSFHDGSIAGPLAVPTSIEKLWISRNGLSSPKRCIIKAVSVRGDNSKMTSRTATKIEYAASAVDESETKLLVKIDGLRMSPIENSARTDTCQAEETMYHSLSWLPDVSLLRNDSIIALCSRLTHTSEPDESSKISIIKDLEIAASIFIAKTLETVIGSYPQPYLERYALWAERHLNRLCSEPTEGVLVKKLLEDDNASEHFIRQVEAASGRGKLIVKVGRSLRLILSGEIDPLGLLFGDSDDLVRQTYTFFNDDTSSHWKKFLMYLKLLSQQNPKMNILEIGAGTGATTEILMKTFIPDQKSPRLSRYDYTDISSAFFDEAKRRFGSHQQVKFKILNIELDPSSQGFQCGNHDLIIASNVLHATKDIRATLRNVYRLLKPGGKLVLYEATNIEVLRTSFAFGILPGWWLGNETFRSWGATMTSEVWEKALVETGFSGIDMIFSDYEGGSEREFDIMVSTASKSTQQQDTEVAGTSQKIVSLSNGRQGNGNFAFIRNGLVTPPLRKMQIFHLIIDIASRTQSIIAHQIQYDFNSRQNTNKDTELIFHISNLSRTAKLDNLDTVTCIFLLETDRTFLHDIDKEQFANLQHIICSSRGILWLNCAGGSTHMTPSYALVDGLSRVIRSEFSAIFIIISFQITTSILSDSQVDNLFSILSKTDFDSSDVNYEPIYLEVEGTMNIGRVIEEKSLSREMAMASLPRETRIQRLDQVPALQLQELECNFVESGMSDLPTFVVDQTYDIPLQADELEIKVHALGLLQDSSTSTITQFSNDKFSSLCWSGVVTRLGSDANSKYSVGDKVFMLTKETCKTHLRGKLYCTRKMPPNMSFCEAAVLPMSFVAAWQCINGIARLENGESILIHEAIGSLLDAAIRISQYLGAEIFVTVATDIQKGTLTEKYGIPETHVLHADDHGSFVAELKRLGNKGVDVVFNLSTGESCLASWGLVNPYGRFVDINKSGLSVESELSLHPFIRGASLSSFDLKDWLLSKPAQIERSLERFVELSETWNGTGPIKTLQISKIKGELALMSQIQMANDIALEMKPFDEIATLSKCEPTYSFQHEATYIIAGGLGSIGRATARWMITRGATNIILLSRSGPKTPTAKEFLSELCTLGINIAAPICDITSLPALRNTIEHLSSRMPPIKGCIQASMVLSDSTFQSMTYSEWQQSTSPKVLGSWNLHTILPHNLDFFILLSSVSGIVGFPGQSNYAAGNTYLDSLARHRISQGQKGISIALGVVDDDGYLSENPTIKEKILASAPVTPISRTSFFNLLNHFCDPKLKIDEKSCNPIIGLRAQSGKDTRDLHRAGSVWTSWLQCPLFSLLQNDISNTSASSSDLSSYSSQSLQTLFADAPNTQAAVTIVLEALVSKIARMTVIKEELIDPKSAMHNYGVDSLVAIEIRKWVKKEFGAEVAVFDILGGSTFLGVAGVVVEKSEFRGQEGRS